METNKKAKYGLSDFKFLQYFAEPQDGNADNGAGNEQSNDGGNQNTGDVPDKPEHSGNGQADNPNQNTNDSGNQDGTGDDGDGNAEVFDKPYVDSLRKESAKYRTRAKETQEKFETFASDLKSFLEKNGVQIEGAESKALLEGLDGIINSSRQTVLNAELERVAAKHNIVDSDILSKLIDTTELKFENGSYSGLEEQVKALAESKPYLVKVSQAEPNKPKGGQGQGGTPKRYTENDVKNMSPAQITEALAKGELNHLL